jgi:hypothetical protein
MLTELVYKNAIYLFGTSADILQRLAEHRDKYVTVQELLEDLSPVNSNQ